MKVLIADDSAFMRSALSELLGGRGWTLRTAKNGADVLEQIRSFQPDVVTLDINMPVMDGLTCLAHIMTECPCPVLMLSSLTSEGAMATLEALNMGAVDYITKPGGTVSLNLADIRGALIQKIEAAARARPHRGARAAAGKGAPPAGPVQRSAARQPAPRGAPSGLVLVGSSTGGPQALEEILPQLPADFPWPVVVAQHMPADFTRTLAERLDSLCALRVTEVAQMTQAERGTIYVARGDGDLIISRRLSGVFLMPAPADARHLWHPSVERMVRTALEQLQPAQLIAVQLTGMGYDGAEAMAELRRRGGHTIAQSEDSAVVFGMPGALVERGGAERVLSPADIPTQLRRWL